MCNDASLSVKRWSLEVIGDPTEGALVVAAAKAGMRKEDESVRYPRLDEIPFQSERQYMATAHHDGQRRIIFVKGSLEVAAQSQLLYAAWPKTGFDRIASDGIYEYG